MSRQFWLVPDATAAQIEKHTGMRAIDTPYGALAKAAPPLRLEVELEKLERALHPRVCNCVVVHHPGCPFAWVGI